MAADIHPVNTKPKLNIDGTVVFVPADIHPVEPDPAGKHQRIHVIAGIGIIYIVLLICMNIFASRTDIAKFNGLVLELKSIVVILFSFRLSEYRLFAVPLREGEP